MRAFCFLYLQSDWSDAIDCYDVNQLTNTRPGATEGSNHPRCFINILF